MKYTVEVGDHGTIVNLSKKDAEKQAELYAADGHEVFITFFRKSDGQTGYLNRDGHSPTGKKW